LKVEPVILEPVEESVKKYDSNSSLSLPEVKEQWLDILKAVRPMNHSVEALLRSSRAVETSGHKLFIEVFYKFHKERLETEKCRRIVEECLENIFGFPIRVEYRLGDGFGKVKKEALQVENLSGKEVGEEIIKAAEEIFGVEAI
jgi:hypothetical protein